MDRGTASEMATASDESPLLRTAGLTAPDACRSLGSTREGLSSEEAAVRLRTAGPNVMPSPRGPSLPGQLVRQVTHLFALMLWTAAALAFVGRLPELGWAIIAVVLVNGAFSFVQEYRAERATRALAALLPERSLVLRDGRKRSVPAETLVPGDVLLLREGDRISADARVLDEHGVKVDNSPLTGEAEPAGRSSGPVEVPPPDPLEADNVVFAGTYVTSGSAAALVVATGGATRLGGITRMTGEISRRPTPLRIQLNRMVRIVGAFAVGVGALFFVVSRTMNMATRDAFLFGVGVIVALIPEGLLPTFTLSLALGAKRMAARGALVRHLDAVETLGSTTVICTDKTGTVTANQMTVKRIALPGATYDVSGSGYEPRGTLLFQGHPLSDPELAEALPLLHAAALCQEARLEYEAGRWRCVGDPTEGALLVVAGKGGIDRSAEERRAPRVREFPFESERQRMSTVHALPSGAYEVLTKGSPETIVPLCKSVRVSDASEPLMADRELRIRAAVDAMAREGLRVLAFARRELDGPAPATALEAEEEMEFLGMVGMADPVRPEVPDALARCQRAGIRVVMLTGDHPATAMTVGREAGLSTQNVLLGSELPDDDQALADLLMQHVVIIARVTPEQKLRIAHALQAHGEVVAMTGDGVNDAPALRRADIGVSMGKAGTDVAREASDLILLDDNFAHIVEAVEEGRAAFDNMKRFLTYVLTSNVPELAPFLVWALSAGSFPLALTVLQILAVDLGTDLIPALALGAERSGPRTMEQPPRPRRARLLDRQVLGRAYGFLGPIQALVSLSLVPIGAALFFGWSPGDPLPATGVALAVLSTMVWSSIVALQVPNGLECRSTRASIFQIGLFSNRMLLGAIVVELLVMMAFVYLPGIRSVLGHHPLTPLQWLPVLLAPFLLFGAEEARKAWVRARGRRPR